MKIKINGKTLELNEGASIENVILSRNINRETVVVELNEKIIKKMDWKAIYLKENDAMEIIAFVGGG